MRTQHQNIIGTQIFVESFASILFSEHRKSIGTLLIPGMETAHIAAFANKSKDELITWSAAAGGSALEICDLPLMRPAS
jgi:hypothetical protein